MRGAVRETQCKGVGKIKDLAASFDIDRVVASTPCLACQRIGFAGISNDTLAAPFKGGDGLFNAT